MDSNTQPCLMCNDEDIIVSEQGDILICTSCTSFERMVATIDNQNASNIANLTNTIKDITL